jgi:quinol monooxygenase YgiN
MDKEMLDEIVLVVRFRVSADSRPLLEEKLKEVFAKIKTEDTFVNATILRDVSDPEQLLVYEVWRETPESFVQNQLPRSYRAVFEQAIVDLKVERTPQWLTAISTYETQE